MTITTTTKEVPPHVRKNLIPREKGGLRIAIEALEADKCLEVRFTQEALKNKPVKKRVTSANSVVTRMKKDFPERKYAIRTMPDGFDVFRVA